MVYVSFALSFFIIIVIIIFIVEEVREEAFSKGEAVALSHNFFFIGEVGEEELGKSQAVAFFFVYPTAFVAVSCS